jgi:hypothetical protein
MCLLPSTLPRTSFTELRKFPAHNFSEVRIQIQPPKTKTPPPAASPTSNQQNNITACLHSCPHRESIKPFFGTPSFVFIRQVAIIRACRRVKEPWVELGQFYWCMMYYDVRVCFGGARSRLSVVSTPLWFWVMLISVWLRWCIEPCMMLFECLFVHIKFI